MANQDHVALLKQGIEQWNQWRRKHPAIQPDLSGADLNDVEMRGAWLRDANLRDANLRDANLKNANLSYANLSYAKLSGVAMSGALLSGAKLSRALLMETDLSYAYLGDADLSGADLSGAKLSNADLSGADLSDTKLSNADLSNTVLSGAKLSSTGLNNANLRGATVWRTVFARLDLRQTKGLNDLKHRGPSIVELHTVQLPQDSSVLPFLCGTGVPDEWIKDYSEHMKHPIQYSSCFISYSNKDKVLAQRLRTDLRVRGVLCWFAPEDLKIGDKFRPRIDEAIRLHEKLLLILSEASVESTWVESEVEAAFEKEAREKRLVLFPIRIDESVLTTKQAWAATLYHTRHIGDFTRWRETEEYAIALGRLLRDLKRSGGD